MTRIFAKLSHLWAPSEDELLDIYHVYHSLLFQEGIQNIVRNGRLSGGH